MAKKLTSPENHTVGVDSDYTFYDLVDMFFSYYNYHNDTAQFGYDSYELTPEHRITAKTIHQSRFQILRQIESARLGARPFPLEEQIAVSRPNVSLGYTSLFTIYAQLPFKAILTDGQLVKVKFDRKLYDAQKLSAREKQQQDLDERNNPNLYKNMEVSDTVSDAFSTVLRMSKKMRKVFDQLPLRVTQDALAAVVHSDVEWMPEVVHALDLVTEPQCGYDPCDWGSFFVIKKITAEELRRHIREDTPYWNIDAIRWALSISLDPNHSAHELRHHGVYGAPLGKDSYGENFSIRSFYAEKGERISGLNGLHGNLYVIEGYYVNKKGKVDKVIFFPSRLCQNVPKENRYKLPKDQEEHLKDADVLFYRGSVFDSMDEAITVFPADRGDPSLERQRFYGHELSPVLQILNRVDSSIINLAIFLGLPLTKNRLQGTGPQQLEDLEIDLAAATVDLGDRDLVETHFRADLNAMIGVRQMLLTHAASKVFLGGLDGNELKGEGRGAQLANMRLVRDGRVHKHFVSDFCVALREMCVKIFRRMLDLKDKDILDNLAHYKFFELLLNVYEYPETLFEFDKDDLLEDTHLPYWMSLDVIHTGASYFGAAEIVVLSELKNIFGDGLNQRQLQNLNTHGIKSLLGQEEAMDILGDPKNETVTERDQIYQASLENASIMGSVDLGAMFFQPIDIREDKDDHVAHLTSESGHLPIMQNIIEKLQSAEITPATLPDLPEDTLHTRATLILRLSALANHASRHAEMLERFGARRDDINKIKEETNIVLQTSEGLLNQFQYHLRALETKRREKEQRLANISPENEAEKAKAEVEMMKIQAERERDQNQLMLANKIADQKQSQHVNKQVSKQRDRQQKERQLQRDAMFKARELEIKQQEVQGKNQERLLNTQNVDLGGGE